jgi:hypothetical protein
VIFALPDVYIFEFSYEALSISTGIMLSRIGSGCFWLSISFGIFTSVAVRFSGDALFSLGESGYLPGGIGFEAIMR